MDEDGVKVTMAALPTVDVHVHFPGDGEPLIANNVVVVALCEVNDVDFEGGSLETTWEFLASPAVNLSTLRDGFIESFDAFIAARIANGAEDNEDDPAGTDEPNDDSNQ